MPRRLWKNQGGYHGETIAIDPLLDEIHDTALRHGWASDLMLDSADTRLRAYRRDPESARRGLYLSAGIHGDEPAGPVAILRLLKENAWPDEVSVRLCPCLNPTGFRINRRENGNGIDLNRDYRNPQTAEVRAHLEWLSRQPDCDLGLILHEDWEAGGFYLYELNAGGRPSLAARIVEAVRAVCPIEAGPRIDGWPIEGGVIRPAVFPEDRPQWPEAIYLAQTKARQSYTLEAPSDFELPVRVTALANAAQAVLASLQPIRCGC